MDRKKIGQALVNAKKMTPENYKHALAMHDKIGGDFGPLLVKLGYVQDEDLTEVLAKLEGIPTIDVASLIIPKNLVKSVSRDVIEKHNVIPIRRKGDLISLAMSDINDLEAIEEIQFLTSCKIEPLLASRDAIRRAIIQFYYEQEEEAKEEKTQQEETETLVNLFQTAEFSQIQKAVIELLMEKNIFTQQELINKVRQEKK